MGGIALTVTTKDRPEQSLFEDYIILHIEMYLNGCLAKDPPKDYREPSVELGKKEAADDEPPIEIRGPFKIFEDEDMLPEVAALVPAPCWQLTIYCTISSRQNWELAEDIARRVAERYRGAVYSPEMGIEWPEMKYVPPVEKRYFDLLRLEWFVHSSKAPVQSAQVFLDALKDFPEARPVRFGTFRPLQEELKPDDDKPFLDAWRDCGGEELIFKSRSPCLGGSIEFPQDLNAPYWSISGSIRATKGIVKLKLEFEEGALAQEQLEKAIRLFVELARRLECFHARGYVNRGYYLNGGDLMFGPSEVKMPPAIVLYGWQGIPPYLAWLNWFGRPYKELVMSSVRRLATSINEEGVFVRLGVKPADMQQLEKTNFGFDLPKELLEGWSKRSPRERAALEKEEIKIPPDLRGMRADRIPKLDD